MDPTTATARERQIKALLEQRDAAFANDPTALEQLHYRARRTTASVEAGRARALRHLAAERAGLASSVPRRLGRAA